MYEDNPTSDEASDRLAEESILAAIRSEAFIVQWAGPTDKGNPQNLSNLRKWGVTLTLALFVLLTTFSSSAFSALAAVTAQEFGVSVTTMVLGGTSLFMVGFALGPIVFGPLSERYGRKLPLVLGYCTFSLLQFPVASSDSTIATVFAFRFLQGFFGSGPSAILSGTLADIWTPKQRGFAMPCTGAFLMVGPILGPILASLIAESGLGWRWLFIYTALFGLASALLTYPILPETYPPVLLAARAKRIRYMTKNWAIRAKSDEQNDTWSDFLDRYLSRPAKMLIREPILLALSTYISVIFGLMYMFFMAYPFSMAVERGWNATTASLPLLSILVGTLLGATMIILSVNTRVTPDAAAERPPEFRMILMMIGSISLPCGMLWFAASSSPNISPWSQILAGVPIGIGIILINMQAMNYIVDCYLINANSAIAVTMFMRSLFASSFPLFVPTLYISVGVARATTLVALFAIILAPIPFLLFKYGAKIRSKSRWIPQ